MTDYKQLMIDRHESLWTNGQLVRTKHKNWELYKLVDPTNNNSTYVIKERDGNWATAGEPRGNRISVISGKEPMPTFEDLRNQTISQFPAHREFYTDRVQFVNATLSPAAQGMLATA